MGTGNEPTAHGWSPTGQCGAVCAGAVAEGDALLGLAAARRWAGLGAVAAISPLMLARPLLPAPVASVMTRGYARLLMKSVGVRFQVLDDRGDEPSAGEPVRVLGGGRGVLVVADHVSWLDILALSAVGRMRFVAKSDIGGWPLLGGLVEGVGTLMHDRDRLRALPHDVGRAADALRRGETVAVFPEGTTWCGRSRGRYRPAFFEAARSAGAMIQPVEIRHLDGEGRPCTTAAFLGDETLPDSLRRVVRRRVTIVELRLAPPLGADEVVAGTRRELARRAQESIRGPRPVRARRDAVRGPATGERREAGK